MNRPAKPVPMSAGQRSALEKLSRSQAAPHRQVVPARALLMAADGVANDRIAGALGISTTTVRSWRARFAEDGIAQLGKVREGKGAEAIDPCRKGRGDRERDAALQAQGAHHWSCRTMAAEFGVSPATVVVLIRRAGLTAGSGRTVNPDSDVAAGVGTVVQAGIDHAKADQPRRRDTLARLSSAAGEHRVRVRGGTARHGRRPRCRADGRPQPELAFLGFMGTGREVVVVGRGARVEGADVVYELDGSAAASVFRATCDRGVVQADVTTGLAMVKPPSDGVNGTHLRGGRDRW